MISCNSIYCVPRKKRKERERHTVLLSDSCTRSYSTEAEPTNCTEHGAMQKSSKWYTRVAVSIGGLLTTIWYSGNCDN